MSRLLFAAEFFGVLPKKKSYTGLYISVLLKKKKKKNLPLLKLLSGSLRKGALKSTLCL